ncbi:alpha-1,4-glucan--maltose-1-phosphate maltosyltransferase [Oculatella sp. LEGE 06141]|uniref:alpha-1,4-glucan--maltose-1-phosphate maltosyltransferase n=1 Tax=Oculatella sp. LEGE 06141 TaxID=1828648 RepID=UPI0018812169|nr:alpha-1,4-glucan--maltose-1-phosphate maltosyltransferase [Oculatella sp. LEGE 06141]MBE9181783.1 alpha-1,4-glucan--maltose-1-phosphate maltosyltransferase [Oculatella sp. LEGE 06141]
MLPEEGRRRVQLEGASPEIDGGRFPIKRIVGEQVDVEVDMFSDGHNVIAGVVRYRPETSTQWLEAPLTHTVNDRWCGTFTVTEMGRYVYTFTAWVDDFETWRRDLRKRLAADQDISVDLLIGAELIEHASKRATGHDADVLGGYASHLRSADKKDMKALAEWALSDEIAALTSQYPNLEWAATYERELGIVVDRQKARFSTWYELFPRSCGAPGKHGTFKDCEARLPYIASLGFDVLYLPPIHPVGSTYRKGKNNSTIAGSDDVGVPWGIGSAEGGHKSVHPDLGTLADFRSLVAKAQEYGIEIALDLAYQCSPDHPYVKEHPEWFRHRPDGTIQYAENPPKKYQDIYPIDFETENWQGLWEELRSVVLFWIEQGVKIFRVDNPHTKAFPFWEWMIGTVKHQHPETLFLAEAFTRPKVMYRLAKLGFSQSYTYFTWRNGKDELTEYLTELTQSQAHDFFRPNFWPNTPDILHEYLQHGGRPAFIIRLALAATMTANYGIYGPAFEVCENRPLREGSEEYLDSEKYQIREWDLDSPYSIKDLIARVNQARKEHLALQSNHSIRFHHVSSDQLICYTKQTADYIDRVLVVVNLNPYHTQSGWVDLPLESLGLDPYRHYQLYDVLTDAQYTWFGGHNYVELNPYAMPAHIFSIKQ